MVNALLNDGSTKSYKYIIQINHTSKSYKSLQGQVLNGKLETGVVPVELMLESLDGKGKLEISVFTVKKVQVE